MILRGEVYDARLDPVEGSEQAGVRPVIIVSRNALHANTYRGPGSSLHHLSRSASLPEPNGADGSPEGGLDVDSVVLAEQVRVLSQARLLRRRGILSVAALTQVERALVIAFDLPDSTS